MAPLALVLLLVPALLAACAGRVGTASAASRPANAGWPSFGRSPENTRYSPLAAIDAGDVGRLRLAWRRGEGLGQATWETFPLVVGGRMYVTTNTDEVLALDARTGALLWSYVPKVGFFSGALGGGGDVATNRGVAVAGGRVFELTFDDHLVALDAHTGRLLWRVAVAEPRFGYYETTAPSVADGLVFVGSSGGGVGVRGFVAAYRATTGTQVWRDYTVPLPGHGWMPAGGHHGGGAVWMPPTIDPRTGMLYAGTGNPSPVFIGSGRRGQDPETSGILALRARTGRRVWFRSLVPHDLADHDAASPVVIFDVHRGGRTIRAVGEAGKSGRYVVLAAATGTPLDPPARFVTVRRPSRVASGLLECPGELGGSNYAPVAYSPARHAVYVSGINDCTVVHRSGPALGRDHEPGQPDLGATVESGGRRPTGTFSAIDVDNDRLLWSRAMPAPMDGGAAATAGGLVFAGDTAGNLYAFSAGSGRILWRRHVRAGFGSAPIVYAVGGREYLAVVSGGSSSSALDDLGPVGGTLLVFTLGGDGSR